MRNTYIKRTVTSKMPAKTDSVKSPERTVIASTRVASGGGLVLVVNGERRLRTPVHSGDVVHCVFEEAPAEQPRQPPRFDPSDRKVHVVKNDRREGLPLTLCGLTGQSWVSSASGWWGPEGKGWSDMCRACHRIEYKLAEPVA